MSIDIGDEAAMKALIDGASTETSANLFDEPENIATQTALHNVYSFWFHRRGHQVNKAASYEETIIKLGTFRTVEYFWRIYDHIIKPNEIKASMDYHMFKDGIKPTWEDSANRVGGKWMVRVKKGLTSMYWEDLVLAIVGEQFDVGHEICGAVVSVRNDYDIISVWNKTADNVEATNKIRDQLRRILKLPSSVAIEYKKHQESLTDNSSYRNPTIVWRAPVNDSNSNFNNFNRNNFRNNPNTGHPDHRHGAEKQSSSQHATHQNGPSQSKPLSNAPPGVVRESSKDGGKPSRWDALAPKSDHSAATSTSQSTGNQQQKSWRSATGSSWSSGSSHQSAWGSQKSGQNPPEAKLERESSSDSNNGYVTAPEDDSNIMPAESSVSADAPVVGADGSQIKGKSIGGWFKSKLAQNQAEAISASSTEGSNPSSPPPAVQPKPNAWRVGSQEGNAAAMLKAKPSEGGTTEPPKNSWSRGPPNKKES